MTTICDLFKAFIVFKIFNMEGYYILIQEKNMKTYSIYNYNYFINTVIGGCILLIISQEEILRQSGPGRNS